MIIANDPNAPIMPYFAVFIAIWSAYYLEYWKRKEKDVALKWGMVGFEENVEARPEFVGTYQKNPVNGELYIYFPHNEYIKRAAQSFMVIGVLIAIVIALLAGIFYFRY
jgi:hypothetical protein